MILADLLGSPAPQIARLLKSGIPNALFERPRKRKNYAENFKQALS